MSQASWWASKVRQFRSHVRARVTDSERAGLGDWLTGAELQLFDRMHVADRRHGLDVVRTLRADGVGDRDVLVAGLLHDAGKGEVGVWPRVVWSLGEAYGSWIWRIASLVPWFRRDLDRLRGHAAASARLAEAAGCSPRTLALIAERPAPADASFGVLLHRADEAN